MSFNKCICSLLKFSKFNENHNNEKHTYTHTHTNTHIYQSVYIKVSVEICTRAYMSVFVKILLLVFVYFQHVYTVSFFVAERHMSLSHIVWRRYRFVFNILVARATSTFRGENNLICLFTVVARQLNIALSESKFTFEQQTFFVHL